MKKNMIIILLMTVLAQMSHGATKVIWSLFGITLIIWCVIKIIFEPFNKKHKCKKFRHTPGVFLELTIDHIKIKGVIMTVIAKPDQFATGEVNPQDRKGKPAQVQEGSVAYESDNETVCTVEEDPSDEKKFKLNFLSVGFANVKVSADADLGEGVVTVEGTLQVVVEPEQATGFGVAVGEPQDNA